MPPASVHVPFPARNAHVDPDPYYRREKYQPRILLMSSFSASPFTETESPAEQEEIIKVLQRMQSSTFIPINRKAPLCGRFIPDPNDKEDALLLARCATQKTPEALFPPQKNRGTIVDRRYMHARDRGMLLLQTDGACLDNGQPGPRAGAAWVFGPPNPKKPDANGICATTLDPADATSNRAELVAAITALRARVWQGEGFHTIVVATDSEYVVNGCTELCRAWEARGWKTSRGRLVKLGFVGRADLGNRICSPPWL